MATIAQPRKTRGAIRTRTIARVTVLWAAVALTILTYQSIAYSGLVALVAEWQFDTFSDYYPVATIFWLLALLISPLLILLAFRLRRRRRELVADGQDDAAMLQAVRAIRTCTIFVALAMLVVAAGLFIAAMRISADGTPRTVVIGTSGSGIEGPARIKGILRLDRLGMYRQGVIGRPHETYLAPLTATSQAGVPLQYFAETQQTAPTTATAVDIEGVLVRNALPGPVRRLYRDAGYTVSDPAYVLFRTVEEARRPYISAIVGLALMALVLGALALIQHRSARRLERAIAHTG